MLQKYNKYPRAQEMEMYQKVQEVNLQHIQIHILISKFKMMKKCD